ncbi:FAD:protein FMN transferase [Desulfonatronovibrio hydrogenovorans]|uniref:FAD:protein FMN transferase n=1 Tax=Desulfonatronovibrio hydrogenovorans TaxID=53245 RepID=UPI00068AA4F1|nr:FAD:protein FMN transferase [Desulfonatronovibrio hydrogenovorans]
MTIRKIKISLGLISLGLSLLSCSGNTYDYHVLSGQTMGTYFRVTILSNNEQQVVELEEKILSRFGEINRILSVFIPDSQVSQFNALKAGQTLCVAPEFQEIMRVSFQVHELTSGAFDPTLGPVIDLWGFGVSARPLDEPDHEAIARAMSGVGLDNIVMDEQGCLKKTHPDTRLNLSGVAKGFGVDEIKRLLTDQGLNTFLVDIGGDIFASGKKMDQSAWRIGVSVPSPGAAPDDLVHVLELTDQAVATSGDYRNYLELGGRKFSHIIDPDTGYPVRTGTVSATVKAKTCVLADALATAMLVMTRDAALDLARESELFETMLIEQDQDLNFSLHFSQAF